MSVLAVLPVTLPLSRLLVEAVLARARLIQADASVVRLASEVRVTSARRSGVMLHVALTAVVSTGSPAAVAAAVVVPDVLDDVLVIGVVVPVAVDGAVVASTS